MNKPVQLSVSLLSADMACFERSIDQVARVAHYLHCDVMDNHFVPNLTFGAPVVKSIKRISPLPLDVHLMIANPSRWIGDFLDAGLTTGDFLTFHIEAEPAPLPALKIIREAGVKPGIVLKPGTSADTISGLEEIVDQVLIMTVEPGFGGQKFMHGMLKKIATIRSRFPDEITISVDGGIDPSTAPLVFQAGANLLVAGNAVFGKPNPSIAVEDILRSVNESGIILPNESSITP